MFAFEVLCMQILISLLIQIFSWYCTYTLNFLSEAQFEPLEVPRKGKLPIVKKMHSSSIFSEAERWKTYIDINTRKPDVYLISEKSKMIEEIILSFKSNTCQYWILVIYILLFVQFLLWKRENKWFNKISSVKYGIILIFFVYYVYYVDMLTKMYKIYFYSICCWYNWYLILSILYLIW